MSVSGNITLFAGTAITLRRRLSRVCARFPPRIPSVKNTRGLPLFLSCRINILEQPERVKKRALSALCTWRYSLVSRLPLLHHSVRIATASSPKLHAFPLLYPSISFLALSLAPFLTDLRYCPLALRFVRLLRLLSSSSLRLSPVRPASSSLFLFEIKSYSENKGNVRTNALISIATIREARFPN